MTVRIARLVAACAAVTLVAAVFVAPAAVAKKGKGIKCAPFTSSVEEAAGAEVLKITPKATEAKPVSIEYEHAASLYPASSEHLYYNVQVYGPSGGLYILQEFDNYSDIDLYLLDGAGEEVASSGAFNPAPVPGVTDAGGNGGTGYESINGHPVATCDGFTIDSSAYATMGTPATLKIWLGEPAAEE